MDQSVLQIDRACEVLASPVFGTRRRPLAGQQGLAVAVPAEAFLRQGAWLRRVDAVEVLRRQPAEQERRNRFVVEVVAQSGQ